MSVRAICHVVAGILLGCLALPTSAQVSERLGSVTFPTSCAGDVQKPFERGVALLHSFVYEEAEPQFADVFKRDPHCAIALWGEAMSIYYPLWFEPSTDTLAHGRELIDEARKLQAGTQRERDYIAALASFYDGSEKTDYESRTAAYAHAMEGLAAQHPEDHEAAIFYALALLATPAPKDAPLANRLQAAEILMPLYTSLPDHPGVIHYLVHAYDTPELAKRGLPMARRYAQIAPSAPHAVHMPSHIFTLIGLWREDIASNLAAERAGAPPEASNTGHGLPPLHFLDFLSYAYLQVGNEAETQKIIDQISSAEAGLMPMMQKHALLLLSELPVRYALELHQWSKAASLAPVEGAPQSAQADTYWARAIGAARSADLEAARRNVKQFETLESPSGPNDPDTEAKDFEAKAWIAHGEHRDDEAITALREADKIQENADTTAHDWMAASALEMLADLLLELNRPAEALDEYHAALKLTPNRLDALYGAARSATKAGRQDEATSYFKQMLENCSGSTSPRPELKEAREFVQNRQ